MRPAAEHVQLVFKPGSTQAVSQGLSLQAAAQVVMAVLSYLYYNNYAAPTTTVSIGSVMTLALQLDRKQQLALLQKLVNLLVEADAVPAQVSQQLQQGSAIAASQTLPLQQAEL